MQKPYFFGDQLVENNDMNYIIDAISIEVARRLQGNLGNSGGYNETALSSYVRSKAGVLGSPGDNSSLINLKTVQGSSSSEIIIYSGSALDTSGELIYIDSPQTLQKNIATDNYDWTSTVGTNYVKLSYMMISGSVKTDDGGNGYPTRYYSSWFVTIDGVSPTSSEIVLATFTGDGSGDISAGTLTDTRLYCRHYTFADAVGLDPYNTPINTHKSVGDHVRATGSGSPSLNNPHGLTFSDLGGSNTLLTATHATDIHINCIIPYMRTPSAINSYLGTVQSPTSSAYISFTAPTSAVLIVNGIPFSGSISNLYAIDAYNIAGDGTYYAVVNEEGTPSWIPLSQETSLIDGLFSTTVDGSNRWATGHINKNYFILGRAVISDNGDDISNWIDSRLFYGTHPIDIGSDYSESVLDPNSVAGALTRSTSLSTNLARIRYQLGKAINGGGSSTSWKTSSYPLTAGNSSIADSYHTHNFDNLADVSPTNVTISKLEDLVGGDTSFSLFALSDDISLTYNTPTALTFNTILQGEGVSLLDGSYAPVSVSGSIIGITIKGWYEVSAHAYIYNYGYGGGFDEFGSGAGNLILNAIDNSLNYNGLTRDFIDPLKYGHLKCNTKVLMDPANIDSPYSYINATVWSQALNNVGNPTSVTLKQKMSDTITVGNLNPWYATFISIRRLKLL